MKNIQADNDTLLKQAIMTASEYFAKAVRDIDEMFGEGYAKEHPELIGAYMHTAAIDLATAVIARAIEAITP